MQSLSLNIKTCKTIKNAFKNAIEVIFFINSDVNCILVQNMKDFKIMTVFLRRLFWNFISKRFLLIQQNYYIYSDGKNIASIYRNCQN